MQDSDALARANGAKLRDIKKEAVARLCNEAYKQKRLYVFSRYLYLTPMRDYLSSHFLKKLKEF